MTERTAETLHYNHKATELIGHLVRANGSPQPGVLLITPYYAKATQKALVGWLRTIAGEFPDVPFIVCNVATRTAVDVNPSTVLEIRHACDNVVGIKEATKDCEHFSRVPKLCGPDFLVWSGIELLCLPLLALGGAGYISVLANIASGTVLEYEGLDLGHLLDGDLVPA